MTRQEMLDEIYDKIVFDWKPFLFNKWWHIGDVLDWYDKNNPAHLWWWNWEINGEIIVRMWYKLRHPIEEQSDECIEFVYNLIKKVTWNTKL